MKFVIVLFALYVFLLWCWSLYLAVMMLSAKRAEITNPLVRALAWQVVAVGLLVDIVLLNLLASVFLFADWPRGWKFTDTLKFQKAHGGRRGRIAGWICAELLNRFDPRGVHC